MAGKVRGGLVVLRYLSSRNIYQVQNSIVLNVKSNLSTTTTSGVCDFKISLSSGGIRKSIISSRLFSKDACSPSAIHKMEEVSSTTTDNSKNDEQQQSEEPSSSSSSSQVVNESEGTATSTSSSEVTDGMESKKQEQESSSLPSTSDDAGVSGSNGISNADQTQPKKIFLRKRKCVLMMSYCGQGYLGMQRNPGTKTIEDDVLRSLLTMGYIDEESYKKPQVMSFQRAARTDKHVSAARQIVSLKIPDNVDLEAVNNLLPPEIRLMGLKKVTKGFDCKGNCDARTYLYMIPTFAFTPIDQEVVESYRMTPEVLENLREALKVYLGTKNFHNFTSRRKPTDPSSMRYIMSFTASDPFIKDGLEYVILRVKGQSFMLHQIRKMIGLIVAYLRGFAGKDTFTKSWSLDRIDIPMTPGLGLVLDHVHYERYNNRFGSDGMHQSLTWDEVNDKVEEFCQQYIYPVITKTENEEKSMFNWLQTLPYHTYDVREQVRNAPLGTAVLSQIGKAAYKVDKNALTAVIDVHTNKREKAGDSSGEESDDDNETKSKRQKTDVASEAATNNT